MNKAWVWLVLLLAIALATVRVYYARANHDDKMLLNCSSELYDHDKDASQQFYLLMDMQADLHHVLLNYRYFTVDGTPVGSIKMRGDIKRNTAGSSYDITVHDKEEQLLTQVKPAHMDYLSYISGLNLTNKMVHTMSLEMLDTDEAQHYAIVRFQPGNAVYGCRLQH